MVEKEGKPNVEYSAYREKAHELIQRRDVAIKKLTDYLDTIDALTRGIAEAREAQVRAEEFEGQEVSPPDSIARLEEDMRGVEELIVTARKAINEFGKMIEELMEEDRRSRSLLEQLKRKSD